MKKYIIVIVFLACGMQLFAQKTIQVNRFDAQHVSQTLENGSKIINFTFTGITSEDQAVEMESFFRSYRGVEEFNLVFDATTNTATGTGRFYKYAHPEYFSFMLNKAGYQFVKIDNEVIPVEELKNL
jgi:hypothetical protein